MVRVNREKFVREWEEERSDKDSKAELLRSEMKALKAYKPEFKKWQKRNTPVSFSTIYKKLGDGVRRSTLVRFLDLWVREKICKRLEIEGDTWYYFDTEL